MPNIDRLQCRWDGFLGAPGYTNFYALTGWTGYNEKVKQFFASIANTLMPGITVTIPNEGETFEATTGELVGSWQGSLGGIVTGSGSGGAAAPAGFVVNWHTGSINRGRKVRGRAFFVPAGLNLYQADGTINPSDLADNRTDAQGLVTAMSPYLVVWSRPRLGTGGLAAPITSATIPDMVAVLRSRRD